MTLLLCLFCLLSAAPFQSLDKPVQTSQNIETLATDTIRLSFSLKLSPGWHVYSTDLPKGGPTSAAISFDSIWGAVPCAPLSFIGNETEIMDDMFGMKVRYFTGNVTFYQDMAIQSDDWFLEGSLTYGACNDESCLPPQRVEFRHGNTQASEISDLDRIEGYDQAQWKPVSYPETEEERNGPWGLFLTSILGGLIALLTPCVWPAIPMTVSYFLKRASKRDAILYGLSIIAVYVALGLIITLAFGANALNSLATNAFVNILFFLILVAFSLSFFGLFEITLPASWSTGAQRIGGIFFMALTLTIVSFSCTGPIIGFLLVDAASTGSILAPTVGMLGFSIALAIPFALFAMFPEWLKSMPKSGAWMDKVKVTLAFVELAFSLKFLSVADMAYGWGILPRDLFVLIWIILAVLLGIYLLRSKPKVTGIAAACISFAFAIWMVPGLWGAPLKAISAFTPPMSTQHFTKKGQSVEPQFTDYSQALAQSARTGKPVLVDFTGYGCVNCRKMEAAVWTDPAVESAIRDNYILVSLFVDDKTALSTPVTINENGTDVKIRTVGDKWSLLQRHKFGANAQPFYVILKSDGSLLAGPYTFNPDPEAFLEFLSRAL